MSARRCTKCILPEEYPGIEFNGRGVCNSCASYKKHPVKGEAELFHFVTSRERRNYDCLIPLSGGRDSTYCLYYAVKRLGLNVLVVHYDNGFRHDQARENVVEACNRLNVDMLELRSRSNLSARATAAAIRASLPYGPGPASQYICVPCLNGVYGSVYCSAEEHDIPLILWGSSSAEELSFSASKRIILGYKTPFSYATSPRSLAFLRFVYLFLLHKRERLPSGNSLLTFKHPKLMEPKTQEVSLFDYVEWDRRKIKRVITEELGWQKPDNSLSTWRFDCHLHAFANYCFKKAVGFNHDISGLANMIRAGKMERAEAMSLLDQGFDSDNWTDKLEDLLKNVLKLPEKDITIIRSWAGPNE